ncbi:tail fiber protein [Paenibacillus sp. EKM208P]|nr:tail fiber protein [Paenibacillus sp. EKM208P]
MAFDGIEITNRGRNLLAKAEAGLTKITYTRFSAGDGKLSGQMPVALKALINEKVSFPVSRLKIQSENVVVPGFEFSNQGITSGFFFREVGLWATDPDLGEILYAYANAGEGAEYIDAQNTSAVLKKLFNFELTVSNTAQVTVIVDDSILYATPQDVADALQKAKDYTDTQILNAKVPDASLTQKGIVQLSESINSVSNALAATPKAVNDALTTAKQYTKDYSAPKQHSHTAADLPSATTQARGIVQLNTSTTSTATDQAATPSAVNELRQLINAVKEAGSVKSVQRLTISSPTSGNFETVDVAISAVNTAKTIVNLTTTGGDDNNVVELVGATTIRVGRRSLVKLEVVEFN